LLLAPTITLSPVQGTAYLYPNGIDYHEPSGSLLLSENYPYGTPYNFDRILFDGTHVQFSNVSGLPSEIYFATVRSSYTYSLAQGFQIGDTFTRTKTSGQIMRIQSDSTGQNVIVTDPWTTLPPPPSYQTLSLPLFFFLFISHFHFDYFNSDIICSKFSVVVSANYGDLVSITLECGVEIC
jgi:hypothetical protein